jgi:hypothetical protein
VPPTAATDPGPKSGDGSESVKVTTAVWPAPRSVRLLVTATVGGVVSTTTSAAPTAGIAGTTSLPIGSRIAPPARSIAPATRGPVRSPTGVLSPGCTV